MLLVSLDCHDAVLSLTFFINQNIIVYFAFLILLLSGFLGIVAFLNSKLSTKWNSNKYSLIFNWKCWLKVKSSNTENCKNKSYLFESVIYLFAFVFIFERVFANKRVAWRNTDGRYKKCLGKSRSSHLISSSSIKSSPNINSYVNSTFWVRHRLVVVSSKSTGRISAVVSYNL